MATKITTIYECDICKKEVPNRQSFTMIRLPYFENGNHYFMTDYDSTNDCNVAECCEECTEKIAKSIAKVFGYYDIDEDKIVTPKSH